MERAKQIIKKFEGLKLKAYLCPAGVWSIGWGSTKIFGRAVLETDTCTAQEADEQFELDFFIVQRAVKKIIKVELKTNEYEALISLAYNIGIGNFSKSTLLHFLNVGAPNTVVAEEFLKWNKARVNGELKPLAGLITRRKEERDLFLNGAAS